MRSGIANTARRVTLYLFLVGRVVAATAPDAPQGPPANLQGDVHQSLIEQMWRDSPTLRHQCLMIATEPQLRVTIRTQYGRHWQPSARQNGDRTKARQTGVGGCGPSDTQRGRSREVSRMLAAAGIRHALAGALAANAYRSRPRTTEDIEFLVGDEPLESHPGGFVTMRVPVVEFDGIAIDQVPLGDALRALEEGLTHAPVSDGVPIVSLVTIVVIKLLAGRTQDLADIEAIASSGADREMLRAAVRQLVPDRAETLERLFENADRAR